MARGHRPHAFRASRSVRTKPGNRQVTGKHLRRRG